MLIEIKRRPSSQYSTIGDLYINRAFVCNTLEDIVRPAGVKVAGQTAIPAGEYAVILDFSNRFQRIMPRLLNVPNFEGIRIHCGNYAQDTEGCILVGINDPMHPDTVLNSRATYDFLFPMLASAFNKEIICVSIQNATGS